jgi:hypothetical protein
MDWLKENWKRVAKWGGLGAGCVVVAVLAFVGARYVSSGAEYGGKLLDLAPSDVSVVMLVDNVPNRRDDIERFMDDLIRQPSLTQLERSSLWTDTASKTFGDSLAQFRNDTWESGLKNARSASDNAGIELFKDALADELVVCTDPGGSGTEMIALSRLARNARFKWQFLDIASAFFPDGPNQPRLEYAGGILRVTPPADGDNQPATILITLLDDVLVVSNSARLLNGAIANHGGAGKSIGAYEPYNRTMKLLDPMTRDRHVAGLWLNLDRMRERATPAVDADGNEVSPIDSFNTLPNSVVAIEPDVFAPVNRIVQADLDTRPFEAAYYGIDINDPGQITFDQYLVVHEERIKQPEFAYLRKTWAAAAARETQLSLLPPDTMLQVSYRQPLDVLFNEVFTDRERQSLVGDFFVALNSTGVNRYTKGPAEEVMFAALPHEYAPGAMYPKSGTDLPLPGFVMGFRVPGADTEVARALLNEYLQAQRGRASDSDEVRTGAVSVVEVTVAGRMAFGFDDPREGDDFIRRLNRSIRAGLVGEWLFLTNSERVLAYAINASEGRVKGLAEQTGSAWRSLTPVGNASIHVDFGSFVDYAANRSLFKVMRDNKFNPYLIEGRDPRELRQDIARELGLDPSIEANLGNEEVGLRYTALKLAWEQRCKIDGDAYEAELLADMNGMRFFRDLAVNTTFAPDHLHVRGILRMGN